MSETGTKNQEDEEAREEQTSNGEQATERFGGGVGKTMLAIGYVALIATVFVALFFLLKAGSGLQAPPAETGGGAAGPRAMVSASKILPHLLLAGIVILVACRIVGELLKKLHQPHVIGEIIAGIMLGPSLLGKVWPAGFDFLFPIELMTYLDLIANLGLIFYMFLVGVELDFGLMRGRGHAAIWVSHASIIAPFLMGVALSLWLYPALGSGGRFSAFSLFMGAAMAITAFPVLARILTDRGLYKTQLGTVALTVGAVDDISAWSMLAVIITIARATGVKSSLTTIGIALAFTLFTIYLVRPVMLRVSQYYERRGRMSGGFLAMLFTLLLTWALVTDKLQIHVIFGAFLFGAMMPHDAKFVQALTQKLEDFSVIFLLPFFFTFSGIRTNIFAIGGSPKLWLMTLVILAVAIAGKWGGSKLAARFAGLSWREAGALGVLVNCRGLTELIILNIGLQLLVLPSTAFAMMVIMAVVTTLMTEPALAIYYSREKQREMIAETEGAEPEGRGEAPGEAEGAAPTWRALVAVGKPERADELVHAATLLAGDGEREAEGEKAEIILLHVVETSGTEVSLAPTVQDHLIQEGVDLLRPLVQAVEEAGADAVPVALPSGDIGETIVRIARERDVDLVLLGHHQAVFGERMLGGEVGHVLRHAEADVAVLVKPRGAQELVLRDRAHILVPYGGGFHEDAGLELAVRLASASGAELSLIGPPSDDETNGQLDERAAEVSDRWGVVTNPIAVEADVNEALVERADEFDLLVLGLSDRWVNQQDLLETVRQEVMHRARRPYLVVRRHDGARGGRLKRWWRRLKRGPRQLIDVYRGVHAELEEAEQQTKERLEGGQRPERPEKDEGREERPSRASQRERAETSGEEAELTSPPGEEEEEAGSQPTAERSRERPAGRTEAPQLDRIVLPIVGGEEDDLAVEAAFSLARSQSEIILEVLGLVGDRGRPDGERDVSAELSERDSPSVERVTYALLRLAQRAQAEGVRLETELLASDRPVDAIMERARGGADLIIVSRPSGAPGGAPISPQDVERLSQEAPCPVVVID